MDKALSDKDLMKLCDGKVNIVKYSELYDYDKLSDLFKDNSLIILYENKENEGHWCCMIRRGQLVEFFDPYGIFPDQELKWLKNGEKFKKSSKQDFPRLSQLMEESPYQLSFNQHKFQKMGAGINTCGRFCAVRIAFKDLPLNKFQKLLINKNYTPDELVTLSTNFI